MATDWFSNSVRKNTIIPNLDKLDSGEITLDQWHLQYGDVPLYHTGEDGYQANYRANMNQLKDWVKANRNKFNYTSDFSIKADAIDEFNTKFPKGKVVQIPHKGPVKDTITEILGGVRSACTYIGAKRLKDMGKCTTFVRVNNVVNQVFTRFE